MAGPDPNAPPADPFSRAWLTLVTRSSYLPGVVLLIHTLYKHNSIHPIIVQYTSTLPSDCISILHSLKSTYPLLRTQHVAAIPLPTGLKTIASRFDDTLTKLRAFQPLSASTFSTIGLPRAPEHITFLDADMMIFRNPDSVFDIPRPSSDWIAAHHACLCNIDNDPWAPPEWKRENCPTTPLVHPSALNADIPHTTSELEKLDAGKQKTYRLMNSGLFVCTPSANLWSQMNHFLQHDPRVPTFAFPDQNFLDAFFWDKWVPVGWQFNAVKTGRYWHAESWRDEEVRVLHYIVDKPWERRVGEDGTAGYLGRDGVTHGWWWREWEEWCEGMGGGEVVEGVKRYVGTKDGEGEKEE
ncbi:unnamed protein product [Zymoseptoria tritici ST99CH_3D1]|uniref:Glycosyltransferase family 8 protein n=1 Tax=Zymoseptoria tritici (strain ST99CH_3D7) TaxID=1276538 RepID=A0A1X7RIF3_ZYMT9|nr:unnamed protein product [Zymoseptoria tritici ST99CH_3D7]SMR45299.1 unnamed protein product [Zymoseptoria tritici ST99CH_3D1]